MKNSKILILVGCLIFGKNSFCMRRAFELLKTRTSVETISTATSTTPENPAEATIISIGSQQEFLEHNPHGIILIDRANRDQCKAIVQPDSHDPHEWIRHLICCPVLLELTFAFDGASIHEYVSMDIWANHMKGEALAQWLANGYEYSGGRKVNLIRVFVMQHPRTFECVDIIDTTNKMLREQFTQPLSTSELVIIRELLFAEDPSFYSSRPDRRTEQQQRLLNKICEVSHSTFENLQMAEEQARAQFAQRYAKMAQPLSPAMRNLYAKYDAFLDAALHVKVKLKNDPHSMEQLPRYHDEEWMPLIDELRKEHEHGEAFVLTADIVTRQEKLDSAAKTAGRDSDVFSALRELHKKIQDTLHDTTSSEQTKLEIVLQKQSPEWQHLMNQVPCTEEDAADELASKLYQSFNSLAHNAFRTDMHILEKAQNFDDIDRAWQHMIALARLWNHQPAPVTQYLQQAQQLSQTFLEKHSSTVAGTT